METEQTDLIELNSRDRQTDFRLKATPRQRAFNALELFAQHGTTLKEWQDFSIAGLACYTSDDGSLLIRGESTDEGYTKATIKATSPWGISYSAPMDVQFERVMRDADVYLDSPIDSEL